MTDQIASVGQLIPHYQTAEEVDTKPTIRFNFR